MKHFWLIRHANTLNATSGQDDFDRGLNQRGRDDAERMAGYWRDQNLSAPPEAWNVDWLVSSTATRAQQTGAYVAQAFGLTSDQTTAQRALYLADPNQILASLKETPVGVTCVALVAHNPGLTYLVNALVSEDQQIDNLPTLGSALFSADVEDWSELSGASLISLMTPKALKLR